MNLLCHNCTALVCIYICLMPLSSIGKWNGEHTCARMMNFLVSLSHHTELCADVFPAHKNESSIVSFDFCINSDML